MDGAFRFFSIPPSTRARVVFAKPRRRGSGRHGQAGSGAAARSPLAAAAAARRVLMLAGGGYPPRPIRISSFAGRRSFVTRARRRRVFLKSTRRHLPQLNRSAARPPTASLESFPDPLAWRDDPLRKADERPGGGARLRDGSVELSAKFHILGGIDLSLLLQRDAAVLPPKAGHSVSGRCQG